MLIGSLQMELYLPGTHSLKEKRFILKSLKTRLRNKFNISVAEVDFQDKWQRCCLGIACISTDRRFLDEILSKVINTVLQDDRVEMIDKLVEIL